MHRYTHVPDERWRVGRSKPLAISNLEVPYGKVFSQCEHYLVCFIDVSRKGGE
jgi:hypothetical protein